MQNRSSNVWQWSSRSLTITVTIPCATDFHRPNNHPISLSTSLFCCRRFYSPITRSLLWFCLHWWSCHWSFIAIFGIRQWFGFLWVLEAEIASMNISDSTNTEAVLRTKMQSNQFQLLLCNKWLRTNDSKSDEIWKITASPVLPNKNMFLVNAPKHRWCTLATHKFPVIVFSCFNVWWNLF